MHGKRFHRTGEPFTAWDGIGSQTDPPLASAKGDCSKKRQFMATDSGGNDRVSADNLPACWPCRQPCMVSYPELSPHVLPGWSETARILGHPGSVDPVRATRQFNHVRRTARSV